MNLPDLITLCRHEDAAAHELSDIPLRQDERLWLFRPTIMPLPLFLFELERQPDGTIRIWVETPTRPSHPSLFGYPFHKTLWDQSGRMYVCGPVSGPKHVAEAREWARDWADWYSVEAFTERSIT